MTKKTLVILLQREKEFFDIALFNRKEAIFWYDLKILTFTKLVLTNFKCHRQLVFNNY